MGNADVHDSGKRGGLPVSLPAACKGCMRKNRCYQGCRFRKERLVYEFCVLAREICEKLENSQKAWKPADIRAGLRRRR